MTTPGHLRGEQGPVSIASSVKTGGAKWNPGSAFPVFVKGRLVWFLFCGIVSRNRDVVFYHFRSFAFPESLIVGAARVGGAVSGRAVRFLFVDSACLLYVTPRHVGASGGISQGNFILNMVGDGSINMVVVLRVLTIRLGCLVIVGGSVDGFASLLSVRNDRALCPN